MNTVEIINHQSILIGKCSLQGLINFPKFKAHYEVEYANYNPEEGVINSLQLRLKDFKFTIVLGTWCGDSLREVPRLLKILALLKIPENDINIIAVDQSKSIPQDSIEQFEIIKVPTFLFYKNDQELGRIVERPIETLEKDMLYLIKQ